MCHHGAAADLLLYVYTQEIIQREREKISIINVVCVTSFDLSALCSTLLARDHPPVQLHLHVFVFENATHHLLRS